MNWNFPSNGGGQWRGISEAGIQTFAGKKISSLAREICQNSLDAVADENSAVIVEFQRHEIYSSDIPGCNEYKNILNKCREFWITNDKKNDKTKIFLDRAIAQLNLPKTFVLRISDFNTTGLAEPYNFDAQDGWNALTKIDGGATKTGDSAGSFGIGKNAPFAYSFWRMVFYRTFNDKCERAAQGISRLVSYRLDDKNISAGVGYFGDPNQNLPVYRIAALNDIYRRLLRGTDIFVYGFNGGDSWKEDIFLAVLENFLVAICHDKLRVKVQGSEINKNNLGKIVTDDTANYYKILSGNGDVKFSEKDFHGMGKLKLGILLDNETKLNRKVLVVRKSGMKLFELDRFPRGINFTGILELEGRELNEFFRELETPAHDKWEPTLYEKNPKLAKEYLTELKRWVRDEISNIGAENISDEVNVEGLGEMLDFDDGAIGNSPKDFETLDNLPTDEIELIPVTPPKKNFRNDNSETRRTTGNITDNAGDNSAIRTLGGTRKRKTRISHTGEPNPDGKDIILDKSRKGIACDKIRVIKVAEKKYRLILKVPQNISDGKIEISAVGENNTGEKLFVTAANSFNSNVEIRAAGEKISFKNLQANVETKITFELQDAGNYALGVDVYAD